jgi:hypothetical protein
LLDPLEVAEPELMEAILALAEGGVPVLALGGLPERAPGVRDAKARDARVRAATLRLSQLLIQVEEPGQLEARLAATVRSSLVEPAPKQRLAVSLERRRGRAGDTLLVVNESWSPRREKLHFTRAGGMLVQWDPWTGERETLRKRVAAGDEVSIELDAAESLILTLEAVE